MIRRKPTILLGLILAVTSLLFLACDDDGDGNGNGNGTTDVVADTTTDTTEDDTTEDDTTEADTTEDDTTEADTTADSNGTETTNGEGACTNATDFAIISTEPTQAQCDACPGPDACDTPPERTVTAIATSCGLDCIAAPDAVACAKPCIMEDAGTGDACSTCYAELIDCTIENCVGQCAADPSSQACLECRADNCNDDFFECSGLGEDDSASGCE